MEEHFFDTRQDASEAAAARIAELLANRLDQQADASLVVSGGSTPLACFAALARTSLDWDRVQVLRSDEVLLLMFGDDKLDVYKAAKQASNGYPISRLQRQKRAPVHVFWAP